MKSLGEAGTGEETVTIPELTSAAGYFFRAGAEGKRTCPTVRPDFGVLLSNILPLYYDMAYYFLVQANYIITYFFLSL